MPTVSNTSSLLNLAIIGQLSLLHQQFGEVWIPPAVVEELRLDEGLPGCRALGEAIEAGWLKVEEVKNRSFVKMLQRDLDKGEAEAIVLALEEEADWMLLDERDGRRVAKSLGLKVTGVLGVLLRAKHEGHVRSLREVMKQLCEKAGFRIGPKLFADIIRRSGEG